MKSESIVFAVAGMCFGVILGWVIASQQAPRQATPAPAQGGQPAAGGDRQRPTLDEGRVQALTTIVESDPNNAGAHAQLGNVYFDAERWDDAIQWYEKALKLDP